MNSSACCPVMPLHSSLENKLDKAHKFHKSSVRIIGWMWSRGLDLDIRQWRQTGGAGPGQMVQHKISGKVTDSLDTDHRETMNWLSDVVALQVNC